jgi:hypothetical protein
MSALNIVLQASPKANFELLSNPNLPGNREKTRFPSLKKKPRNCGA